jgi:hypothetical protein
VQCRCVMEGKKMERGVGRCGDQCHRLPNLPQCYRKACCWCIEARKLLARKSNDDGLTFFSAPNHFSVVFFQSALISLSNPYLNSLQVCVVQFANNGSWPEKCLVCSCWFLRQL